jgi:hypothetical protein
VKELLVPVVSYAPVCTAELEINVALRVEDTDRLPMCFGVGTRRVCIFPFFNQTVRREVTNFRYRAPKLSQTD